MKENPSKNNELTVREKGQIGLFFDQTRCDGCYSCVVACKDWHDVPAGPANWMRVSAVEKGKYPNPFLAFNVNLCYHCANAPCLMACPSGAITKRETDGIVIVDRDKCLGRDECGYPCSMKCPAGNDVLGFVSLMKEERCADAWKLLVESNPFPGVCGRVCPHPCESACNRGQVDEPVAIHALERLAAEHMPSVPPFTIEWKTQKVAVVGSGPAGLSCAYNLVRRAYRVTVFEAQPSLGGMLRLIPEYRLPKAVVDREIAFIQAVGVDMKTNMRLGQDLSLEELNQFDAVFLAVGSQREKTVDIPGVDLNGVISGIDLLRDTKVNGGLKVGSNVVVLGRGNMAIDAARTAVRLGAKAVTVLFWRTRGEMPASPSEIQQAIEEGIAIETSRHASRVLGKNGSVVGVESLGLRSMEADQDGKMEIDTIAGSESVLEADTVILAIGQEPDLSFLPKDVMVSQGMITIDEDSATSRPKYFAGGDAVMGQRRVASAIGSGRRAALAIDRYLKELPEQKGAKLQTTASKLLDVDSIKKKGRVAIPILPVTDRRQTFSEVEQGLDSKLGKAEANRCLRCKGMCYVACPYGAPQFGAENNPKMQKCDFCLEEWSRGNKPICVRSCTMRALDAGPIEELRTKYGDVRSAEAFTHHKKSEPSITFKPKRSGGKP